jgi:hypothetical protein
MGRQHTHSSSFKSIAGAALAGLGILVLLANLDWTVAPLRNFFCATAGDTLGILPCLVLSACQAMQAYVIDHHGLLGWLLQMLLSLWPLFFSVGSAS